MNPDAYLRCALTLLGRALSPEPALSPYWDALSGGVVPAILTPEGNVARAAEMLRAAMNSNPLVCGEPPPLGGCDLAAGHEFDHQTMTGIAWRNDRPGAYARMPECPHGSGVSADQCGLCEDVGIWPPDARVQAAPQER